VTSHTEVETTKAVAGQAVTTALEDNGFRTVVLHDIRDNWLEDALIRGIVDTVSKREVDSVVLALPNSDVAELTGTREVLSVLVERHSHDSVSCVESFLYTIAMMYVDVDVKNSRLESEELDDAEYNV
jgi:hypothetical protein